MARTRALLVSPEPPYPLDSGGAFRSASLLHYLGERYDLDMAVFRHPGQDVTRWLPPNLLQHVFAVDLQEHRSDFVSRVVRNGVRLLGDKPPLVDRFSEYERELLHKLKGRQYDVAVLEHFWTAPYLSTLRPLAKRLVLDLHNVESAWHNGCAHAATFPRSVIHRRFARMAHALEERWLPQSDLILTSSHEDAERVRRVLPTVPICVYPNTMPWKEMLPGEGEPAIAFSGNLEYEPNRTAVAFLLEHIWPALAKRFPALILRLIGKNPQPLPSHVAAPERIQVTGAVDDTFPYVSGSQICVAPLLSGSGTRLKIVEYWAAKRAVVTTAIGAEGLAVSDGGDVRIANDAATFIAAVTQLLEDAPARRRLASAGRQRYERDFTWYAAWAAISLHL